MVQHDVGTVATPNGIRLHVVDISQSETQVADDDVIGVDRYIITFQADAIARSCLSGDGHVTLADTQAAVQADDTGHLEQNGTFAGLTQTPTQGAFFGGTVARVGIVQTGNVIHRTASTSCGEHATAFGSRECRCLSIQCNPCHQTDYAD